jgi:hydroxymethylbilane synthase
VVTHQYTRCVVAKVVLFSPLTVEWQIMKIDGPLRLATRGSTLAQRQTAAVQDRLADRRHSVEQVIIETTGDQIRDELIHQLGKTGAFVRALDEAVLEGEADAAVHSMKDMPTEQPSSLIIAGVPPRAAAGDVLVTPGGDSLEELPAGAVIGTASTRRRAQVYAERSDIEVAPLRGNIDTRVEKLLAPSLQREHERRMEAEEENDEQGERDDETETAYEETVDEWFNSLSELERRALERAVETEYDAIVLAEAGLARSNLLEMVPHTQLDPHHFVPAPGQGAVAVTTDEDADCVERIHSVVDHPQTRVETTVERTILATLGGGCIAPIGVYAVLKGDQIRAVVRVLSADGETEVYESKDLPVENHATAAVSFADDLAERGAATLIEDATEATT